MGAPAPDPYRCCTRAGTLAVLHRSQCARSLRPVSAACTDPPSGQWVTPPAFPSGGGGLASTLDDMHAFGRMLLSGGRLPDASQLLSRSSVEAMTIDQIGADWGSLGPFPGRLARLGLRRGRPESPPGPGPHRRQLRMG